MFGSIRDVSLRTRLLGFAVGALAESTDRSGRTVFESGPVTVSAAVEVTPRTT
ncbi:hypothetical protein [Salinigranum halophilum]|uniref:hypothetical protein n=1 Tax=Salinigranum halophilum TaxID=2565931 RepID=UPI001375E945|nr:hypothetical protein [Salinigranum halophilum]